jgi:hypothetical protein
MNVSVFEGGTNITNNCTYSWSVTNGTLNSSNSTTNYFKTLTADNGSATVTVKKGTTPIGTKTFNISKNKQGAAGADAVTYVMSITPNSWNGTEQASVTPAITITKYIGNTTKSYQKRCSASSNPTTTGG